MTSQSMPTFALPLNAGFSIVTIGVTVLIALVQHDEARGAVIRHITSCSKLMVVYHMLVLVLVWGMTRGSIVDHRQEKDTDRFLFGDTSPVLLHNQAKLMLLFWVQEGIRMAWRRQSPVARGTLQISFVALGVRCIVNAGTQFYLPHGWTGDGPYQNVELVTCCVIFFMMVVTYCYPATCVGIEQNNIIRLVVPAAMLAILFDAGGIQKSTGEEDCYDNLWAFTMYLEGVAWVPQLRDLAGSANAGRLHSSSAAPLVMHKVLGLLFWVKSWDELSLPGICMVYTHQVAGLLLLIMVWLGQAYGSFTTEAPSCPEGRVRDARAVEEPSVQSPRLKEEPTLNQIF